MKQHILSFTLLFCLLWLTFTACAPVSSEPDTGSTQPSHDAQIAELMRQLDELRQSNQQQSEEYEKLLEELRVAMEALSAKDVTTQTPSDGTGTGSTPSTDLPSAEEGKFTYITNGIYATITGFTGKDESLVIPSHIDGYTVIAIGERAFSSSSLKQVTVSSGILTVDWFAFYGCSSLASVSLPASVTEIGYGAFDGCAKALTISCSADSYALAYAKSYGIATNVA